MTFWELFERNYHDEDFQAGLTLLGVGILVALIIVGWVTFAIVEVVSKNRKRK